MFKYILLLASFLTCQPVMAAGQFGTIEAVTGEATIINPSGTSQRAAQGMHVYTGQSIQTPDNSEVHIISLDKGFIAVRPNSLFRIDSYQASGEASDSEIFTLLRGAVRSITGWLGKSNPSGYRLHTATVTIGIRGTDHETVVLENASGPYQPGTYNSVYEGETIMQFTDGEFAIHQGQHAFASAGQHTLPQLLKQQPEFMLHRRLQLEDRILQRKETLRHEIKAYLREASSRTPPRKRILPDEPRRNRKEELNNLQQRRLPAHINP